MTSNKTLRARGRRDKPGSGVNYDRAHKINSTVANSRVSKHPKAPEPLMRMVSKFLIDYGFDAAGKMVQTETKKRIEAGDLEEAVNNNAGQEYPSILSIFTEWQEKSSSTTSSKKKKTEVQEKADSESEEEAIEDSSDDEISSKDDTSSSSESDSSEEEEEEDEDENEEEEGEEVIKKPTPATPSSAVPNSRKRKAASISSDSDSDSDSASDKSSDENSSSESEVKGHVPKRKLKMGSPILNTKHDDSESESSSSSSSDDSASEEDISSNDSSDDSSDDSSSESSEDEEDGDEEDEDEEYEDEMIDFKDTTPTPKTNGILHQTSNESESSATLARSSPEFKSTPRSNETTPMKKKPNEPFRRVPTDQTVDPRFASNAYVPNDYAEKAYRDLSITKGKGFTKEKNKKKRGSYRGGFIDINGSKGIKFED